MKSKTALWLYIIFRSLLGIVFIWSGISKLLSPDEFAGIISAYALLPDNLVSPAAIALPAAELVFGIALLFDTRISLEAVTGMLLLFVAVLLYGIVQDINVDCGCFSKEETGGQNSLRYALYRDFVFIVMVIYMYTWRIFNREKNIPAV